MDDKQLNDLKEFISGAIFQSEERVKSEIKKEMVTKDEFDGRFRTLEKKIDNYHKETKEEFTGVGDAIEHLGNELLSEIHKTSIRLDDHEDRIISLEQAA